MEKHPLHLKNPELQTSAEVQRAVTRKEQRTGGRVPNNPTERVEAYTERLENVFLNHDERTRERNIELFRPKIYDTLLIKKENFPESYFELQQRIARERGQAVEEIPANVREQMKEVAIQDQKASLDSWIDYLSSNDAMYPSWFKLFVWQNITKLSQFDKERGEFKKRTSATVAPFPDIYREPLARIADRYENYPKLLAELQPQISKLQEEKNKLLGQKKKLSGLFRKHKKAFAENSKEEDRLAMEAAQEELGKLEGTSQERLAVIDTRIEELSKPLKEFEKGFPELYAQFIQESLAASLENKDNTLGQWVKYDQGGPGAAEKLYVSLEGKGTGWCTAGRSTAETQIKSGDFHVYYTNDASGTPVQPRLAIRMDGSDHIGEVRGILPQQGVEPIMQGVLDAKLAEFGKEADVYRKKSADMKMLTELDHKIIEGQNLTKNDLLFLYEVDAPIEGFGYGKDPRIAELREGRDVEADMLVIFDCAKEQIAHSVSQITETTKAYVGKLEPGIFQKLPETLEHVYTSFPEGKIRREHLEIGGKTSEELQADLKKAGMQTNEWSEFLMNSKGFTTLKTPEEISTVRLTLGDLGFEYATTDQVYARAKELGLELCPAEVGPQFRLSHPDQAMNDHVLVAMKQILGQDFSPSVFDVNRNPHGLFLHTRYAPPEGVWSADFHFLFRLRKLDSEKLGKESDKETRLQKLKKTLIG